MSLAKERFRQLEFAASADGQEQAQRIQQHVALLKRFYRAFQALDGAEMAGCYHRDAVFTDPLFGCLQGPEISAFWQMWCAEAEDFLLLYSDIEADIRGGNVQSLSRYLFLPTRRHVVNEVHAEFEFVDGLIMRHAHHFNWHRWATSAFGHRGRMLGWTPWFKREVRGQMRRNLENFMKKTETL